MSVDLQIVQHKDCLRCFQSIDERAELCPFCHSSQTVRLNWTPYLALALAVVIALCGFLIWHDYVTVQRQEELSLTIQEMQAMQAKELAEASALQTSLQASLWENKDELEELLRKVAAQAAEASRFCRDSSILSVCNRILADSSVDSLALAKILGRYQALGREEAFCGRMRPLVAKLARNSESELGIGKVVYNKYFLSSEGCWH